MRPDGQRYGERELGLMIEVQWLEERKSGNGFLEAGLACRPRGESSNHTHLFRARLGAVPRTTAVSKTYIPCPWST